MKKLKQLLALFLTLATLLTVAPLSALAAESDAQTDPDVSVSDEVETDPETPTDEDATPATDPEAPTEEPADTTDPEAPAEEPAEPTEPEAPAEEPADTTDPEAPAEEPAEPTEPETPAEEPETPAEDPSEEDAIDTASVEDSTETEDGWTSPEPITWVNPLYADVIDESDLEVMPASDLEEVTIDTNVYASASSAGTAIRKYMKARTTSFSITYTDSEYPSNSRFSEIIDYACAHTGVPTEGDYLKWQYGGASGYKSYTYNSGTYTVELTLNFTYYTSASQESTVNSYVSSLRSSLGLSGKPQYEKVKAIYNWMCSHIWYDHTHVDMGASYPLQFTAYGAIVDKTCVCQGYAVLFYRLALEEGIDARVVTSTNHAWNIVKLDDKYYNLDSTWDAQRNLEYGLSNWSYFLKCPANFDDEHVREYPYSGSSFQSKYPMGSSDYAGLSTPQLAKLENTKSGLTLTWNKVSGAKKYSVYRRKYGTSSWTKVKEVSGTSYTDTSVTSGVTYYYTVRAKSTSSVSASSSNLHLRYLSVPQISSAKNELSGINVTWKKTKGCSGYNVYRRTSSGSYQKIAVVWGADNLNYFDKNVSNGTTYVYRVRAFSGNSKSSSITKTICRLSAPSLTSVKNNASRAMKIQWTKNSSSDGYQVKYVSGSFSKTVTIKGSSSLSTTRTYLTRGKTFKVYVRSYKTVNGVKYYSAWSHSKSVKISK